MPFFGAGGNVRRKYSTLHYLMHAPSFIRLFWRLYRDPRVWFLPKLILAIGVLYFVSPLDLVPGFPWVGIGYIDDVIVLYAAARVFIWLCPRQVVDEHVRLIDQGG